MKRFNCFGDLFDLPSDMTPLDQREKLNYLSDSDLTAWLRSAREFTLNRCVSCKHWDPIDFPVWGDPPSVIKFDGFCRLNPPNPKVYDDTQHDDWPSTEWYERCSHHEAGPSLFEEGTMDVDIDRT